MTINPIGAIVPISAAPQQAAPPTAQQNRALSQAVRIVNDSSLTPQDRQLSLTLDPVTKIAVAKVVDSVTGQVINQLPSEDVLRLAAYLEAQNAQEHAAQTSGE